MARTYLQDNETTNFIGGSSHDDIIGTNAAQTVKLNANANVTFDASFNKGGDTIVINGNAGDYTAKIVNGNLVLTANNGANIVIPVGPAGVAIDFADADPRTLIVNSTGTTYTLGGQTITGTGVAVTPGSGGGENPPPAGSEIELTTVHDNLTGTSAANVFIGDVWQNQNGEETNTMGTGDRLNGGGGNDILRGWDGGGAVVQDASSLNESPGTAIRMSVNSVETQWFNARQVYDGIDEAGTCHLALGVEINASSTFGTTEWGSVGSDTSLTIYNVNTLPSGARLGDEDTARITDTLTVRMDHTGPATPIDDAANMTVLLDNDYLLAQGESQAGAQLFIQLMDIDDAIRTGAAPGPGYTPLLSNPFDQLSFHLDGTQYTLAYGRDSGTYENLLAAMRAGLNVLKAANPELAGLHLELGNSFVATDTDTDPGGSAIGTNIVLINDGDGVLSIDEATDGFRASGVVPPNTDYHKQVFAAPPDITTFLITIEVELEKVGRGGDGGYLTIGGMAVVGSQHYEDSLLQNTWVGHAIAKPGVEQFNVHVEGTAAEPSSLAGIQSTHNALQVVTVDNPGSAADLTIGNSQTILTYDLNSQYNHSGLKEVLVLEQDHCCYSDDCAYDLTDERNAAMKDVRVFDAHAFTADLELHAYFSDEVVDKYLDLMDTQVDPSADNLKAAYTFGGGNDLMNINFTKDNFAYQGAVTREDFEFSADMGAGNDHVQIQIGNGFGFDGEGDIKRSEYDRPEISLDPNADKDVVSHWYANHAINSFADSGQHIGELDRTGKFQLDISTGTGDDFVELWGSTAAHVNLGAGNDVIYTDNSGQCCDLFNGGKAVWSMNSAHSQNVNDLLTIEPGSTGVRVANVGLFVSFQGIESHVAIVGGSTGANGAIITDLQVNQAIKDAINNDAVLSNLLIALDGPGRTLLIESKIDGRVMPYDLLVALVSTGPLSSQQTTAGAINPFTAGDQVLNGIGFDAVNSVAAAPMVTPSWVDLNSDGIQTINETFSNRFDSLLANDNGSTLRGHDSVNVNNNVVEGSTGDDLVVFSSNGVGNCDGSSVETFVITGKTAGSLGHDTVLNFTAAVTTGAQVEIQTIQFTGTLHDYSQDGSTHVSTNVTVTVDNPIGPDTTVTFPIDSAEAATTYTPSNLGSPPSAPSGTPTTPAEIANKAAYLINTDPSNTGLNHYVTATVNGDTVTLTYDQSTAGAPVGDATCSYTPNTLPTHDIDFITFQDNTVAGVEQPQDAPFTVVVGLDLNGDGDLTDPGEQITIDGDTVAPGVNQFAAGTTDTQVAAVVAAQLDADPNLIATVVSDGVENDVVKVEYVGSGSHATPTGSVTDSTHVTLNIATNATVYNYGLGCIETTVQDSRPGEPGWDIFDVTTVIGGAVVHVQNDHPTALTSLALDVAINDTDFDTDGAVINEAASIANAVNNNHWVVITDSVSTGDGSSLTTEAARVQALATAADTAAGTVKDSILITVNADNTGTFYLVHNGAAAKDVVVTQLGSVELGHYIPNGIGDSTGAKDSIGAWDLMSLANFTPLNANTVTDTFTIA